jgi:hypothetical protein
MMTLDRISDLVHSGELTRAEQLLLCLAHLGDGVHTVGAVRDTAQSLGLSDANVSRDMLKLKGLAFQRHEGWTLTTSGKKRTGELLGAPVQRFASASIEIKG